MRSSFSAKDAEELYRLLSLVRKDGGFVPNVAWPAYLQVTSLWAVELVLQTPDTVFLAPYAGGVEEFRGKWHLPGGYGRIEDVNLDAACRRVARAELGVHVGPAELLHVRKCKPGEHPTGAPLSLFMKVFASGTLLGPGRFFKLEELPSEDELVSPHSEFLELLREGKV